MPAFLIDENFHGSVLRGLARRMPHLNLVRVQDIGFSGADDPTILEQAAQMKRVLMTHDVTTITRYAYERLAAGLPMPGILEVRRSLAIGQAIEEIVLLIELCGESE